MGSGRQCPPIFRVLLFSDLHRNVQRTNLHATWTTQRKQQQRFLHTTAATPVHRSWTHACFYTTNQAMGGITGLGGGGCQYWVCSGDFRSGVSVELRHTTVHAGQQRLLTDWCLVTMMVGMGELSAWPLSEPRIWIQEDRKAQGQASLLSSVLSNVKSLMQQGFS